MFTSQTVGSPDYLTECRGQYFKRAIWGLSIIALIIVRGVPQPANGIRVISLSLQWQRTLRCTSVDTVVIMPLSLSTFCRCRAQYCTAELAPPVIRLSWSLLVV